jgi:hypothetical protein
LLPEKAVKFRFCRAGSILSLFRSLTGLSKNGVKGKPVAEIGPVSFGRVFSLGFDTVPVNKKTAMPAAAEIFPAGSASHGSSNGFFFGYRRSAIPTHDLIITWLYEKGIDLFVKLIYRISQTTLERRAMAEYHYIMFDFIPCAAGCGRAAISGSSICAVHAADSREEAGRIGREIASLKTVKDLSATELYFEKKDFSQRHYYCCNFSKAAFRSCNFSGSLFRMTFFDFASFEDCDFSRSDIQFAAFGGADLRNCSFEGSELVHVNYGGAVISDCCFNVSNLYNSRFIHSKISNTTFIDCNLKKTYFIQSTRENVSFKSSNIAESVMEIEE